MSVDGGAEVGIIDWTSTLATIEADLGTVGDISNPPLGASFPQEYAQAYGLTPDELYTAATAEYGTAAAPPVTDAQIPPPDQIAPYSGPGLLPTWADVFGYTSTRIDAQTQYLNTTANVDGLQVQVGLHTAAGETIKALSGFVNRVNDRALAEEHKLQTQLNEVAVAAYNVAAKLGQAVAADTAVVSFIVAYVIPDLQAQITKLAENIGQQNALDIAALKAWTIDNVYTPLSNRIAADNRIQRAYTDKGDKSVLDQALGAVNGETVARVAAVGALTKVVSGLVAESDSCVKPMCATMGPNTPLGNFLKALKIAEWAALLLELANLTEGGLDGLLSQLQHYGQDAIGLFESLFVEGGKTLGDVITSAGG